MQDKRGLNWVNSYRYLGRDFKIFWDRNGGRISTIAGTSGLFLTGLHSCRKTYKLHDQLSENGRKMREATGWKEKAKVAAVTTLKTARHYLPDLVAGALAGYCVGKGWGIEHGHYREATAMVGVIAGSFMDYRKNVIAELGKDADRRFLTTKRVQRNVQSVKNEDGTVIENANGEDGVISVTVEPSVLKIRYSKETTPQVWSPSYVIRMQHLDTITSKLNNLLKCGGHYTINDVRREFYGVKGDVAAGGMYGRVWDPGNIDHPERGRSVDLHYNDDEDFKYGLTDSCWIIIDIDEESLVESLAKKPKDFSEVE